MPNDITRLLATVSALGLSLGVTFDAVAAEPAAGAEVAPAPAGADARTAGYDLKMGKKLHEDAAAKQPAGGVAPKPGADKKLVAVKTISWSHDDEAPKAGQLTGGDQGSAAKTGRPTKVESLTIKQNAQPAGNADEPPR